MRASTAAWTALVGSITAYELWALHNAPDELLSRGMDRARAHSRASNVAMTAAVLATAGHLLRVLGPLDPYRLARS